MRIEHYRFDGNTVKSYLGMVAAKFWKQFILRKKKLWDIVSVKIAYWQVLWEVMGMVTGSCAKHVLVLIVPRGCF